MTMWCFRCRQCSCSTVVIVVPLRDMRPRQALAAVALVTVVGFATVGVNFLHASRLQPSSSALLSRSTASRPAASLPVSLQTTGAEADDERSPWAYLHAASERSAVDRRSPSAPSPEREPVLQSTISDKGGDDDADHPDADAGIDDSSHDEGMSDDDGKFAHANALYRSLSAAVASLSADNPSCDVVALAPGEEATLPTMLPGTLASFLSNPDAILAFPPTSEPPLTSIIILTFNHADVSYRAIRSAAVDAAKNGRTELIIADNASTDEDMLELLRRLRNVKVARHARNLQYAYGHNRAAKCRHPQSHHTLFLNNDAELQESSLDEIQKMFASVRPERVGAVGCRHILINGALQEAGSVMFRNGAVMGFGRMFLDPHAPVFMYVRAVDYVSTSCLAMRNDLLDELAWYDADTFPVYYTDTDMAMRMRWNLGYEVMYNPHAVVRHHESLTNVDMKQELMSWAFKRFHRRWDSVLREHMPHEHVLGYTKIQGFCARDRRSGRNIIAIGDLGVDLCARCVEHRHWLVMLLTLSSMGHKITAIPSEQNWTALNPVQHRFLTDAGIEVITRGSRSSSVVHELTKLMKRRAHAYDMVLMQGVNVASSVSTTIREGLLGALRKIYVADETPLEELVEHQKRIAESVGLVVVPSTSMAEAFGQTGKLMVVPYAVWPYLYATDAPVVDHGAETLVVIEVATHRGLLELLQQAGSVLAAAAKELEQSCRVRLVYASATLPTVLDEMMRSVGGGIEYVPRERNRDSHCVPGEPRRMVCMLAETHGVSGMPPTVANAGVYGIPVVVHHSVVESLQFGNRTTAGMSAGESHVEMVRAVFELVRSERAWSEARQQLLQEFAHQMSAVPALERVMSRVRRVGCV
jgi:GT2 family glycosyltransferase